MRGPHFAAEPIDTEREDRYGFVKEHNQYEVVDQKLTYIYEGQRQNIIPRISHSDGNRPSLYRRWMDDQKGEPSMAFNLEFFSVTRSTGCTGVTSCGIL
jgi:hypothetical protein